MTSYRTQLILGQRKVTPNIALKLAIWNSGKTQTVIAQKTGIHESKLSQIVRGHRPPSDDEQRAIARVLRVPVNELFPTTTEASV